MCNKDIAYEYFTNCIEDNKFDEELIKELSNIYGISINTLKEIINEYRSEYINEA